jgi:peroxiredoxin Q/BCP
LTQIKLNVGDPLPEAELEVHPGPGTVKLSSYKGKWVVLYFYPRDDTPGCTKEACNFRDSIKEIRALGAEVVGVSTDSIRSHQKFTTKYGLNFPLLSDSEGVLGTKLGALRNGFFKSMRRVTFIIDPKGRIAKIYPQVDPGNHSEEVLRDLKTMIVS